MEQCENYKVMNWESTDPARNLASEEVVFEQLSRDHAWAILWQNENAVIVGKYQNTAAEVNLPWAEAHGVKIVRRLSGGGAVYHDLGNLNFTVIKNADPDGKVDLKLFCEPVVAALARFGVKAEISGRNDITVDGKKFSGNAQYIRQGRVMHHGTILFDSDLAKVQKVLTVRAEKIAGKGVDSVRSRVTNLRPYLPESVSLSDFRQALLNELTQGLKAEPYRFSPEEEAAVDELVKTRYGTWEWNYGASPAASLLKRERFEGCGSIEALMRLKKGRISALEFRGDFFSTEDPDGLAAQLIGLPPEKAAIEQALAETDVSRYFTGLSARQLTGLLCE